MCGGSDPIFSVGWNWDFDAESVDVDEIALVRPVLFLPNTYVKLDTMLDIDVIAGIGITGTSMTPILRQFDVDITIEGEAQLNVELREGTIEFQQPLTSVYQSPSIGLLNTVVGYVPIDIYVAVGGVYRY